MSGCTGPHEVTHEVVVIHFRMSCTEIFIKLVEQIPLLARAIYIINGWLVFCWLVCMQRYHCRSDPVQVQSTNIWCLWITLDCNNSLYSCCTDDELQAHLSWWLSNRELKCTPHEMTTLSLHGKTPGFSPTQTEIRVISACKNLRAQVQLERLGVFINKLWDWHSTDCQNSCYHQNLYTQQMARQWTV